MNPWIKRWSPATLAAALIFLSASLGAGQKKAAAAPPAGIQVVEAHGAPEEVPNRPRSP